MKTPLQELIEQLEFSRRKCEPHSIPYATYSAAIEHAESMLEREKEVLMRTYQDGLDNGFANGNWDLNLYYNETFNTKEK